MSNSEVLPPLPSVKMGVYRHYSGKEYDIVAIARHSETLEPLVVYRARYGDNAVWVRPFAMFVESVTKEGKTFPRFSWVRE